MNCGKTRKIIYCANRPEPRAPQWVEAQEHLNRCPECQGFFADDETLASLLRTRLGGQEVPAHLREKILDYIAEARTRERPSEHPLAPRQKWIPVAVVVVLIGVFTWLAGILGYPTLVGDRQQRIEVVLVEDHLRFGPGVSEIKSSRVEQVEAWFSGKVNFAVHAPRFDQAELLGGRLCYLLGKKGARLFYRAYGKQVSLFILDGSAIDLARLERLDRGENPFAHARDKGYSLILWKDGSLVHALVSELREQELVRLASSVNLKGV